VSPELQVAIFDMCVTNVTTTDTVAFAQELLKRGILFERVASRAIEHPNEIIEIFNGLVHCTAEGFPVVSKVLTSALMGGSDSDPGSHHSERPQSD
jgi:hypothetical protein